MAAAKNRRIERNESEESESGIINGEENRRSGSISVAMMA
jgi:hypothetical protein